MEARKYLGIYISKETATVVCLGVQGRERRVLGCFSVSVEGKVEANPSSAVPAAVELAGIIAKGLDDKIPTSRDSEVAVALDCLMFMQHNVHSEFVDPKRIASTVRFDTEEALATDITDVAVAFKIVSSDQNGSKLSVFTAKRKVLSDILFSLQNNNIDPVTMEPDVSCLSRFLHQNVSMPEDLRPFFGLLSNHSGYFILPRQGKEAANRGQSIVRTLLLGPEQDRGELLAREIPLTVALAEGAEPVNCLKLFDSTGSVDVQAIGEKLGMETGLLDLVGSASTEPQMLADCDNQVDFAIAYGAALAHFERTQSVNFRNDFSPFLGRKRKLQKALKFASYSATVLAIAVGLYAQAQLSHKNEYINRLRNKLQNQYSAVMFGKKPPDKADLVKKLAGELRRVKDVKSGRLSSTGGESIPEKLTLALEAFNKCAAQTNLNIESVSITSKTISIVGDASSSGNKNTLKFFESIKNAGLEILQQQLDSKGERDNFRITVQLKK